MGRSPSGFRSTRVRAEYERLYDEAVAQSDVPVDQLDVARAHLGSFLAAP